MHSILLSPRVRLSYVERLEVPGEVGLLRGLVGAERAPHRHEPGGGRRRQRPGGPDFSRRGRNSGRGLRVV